MAFKFAKSYTPRLHLIGAAGDASLAMGLNLDATIASFDYQPAFAATRRLDMVANK